MGEVPKGYYIKRYELFGDSLLRRDPRINTAGNTDNYVECFRLQDRTLTQIDHYLGYLPSQIIEFLIARERRKITIVNIAGGRNARASEDLTLKYGRQIKVIDLDILHNPPSSCAPFYRVTADGVRIPFADDTFDFAISYQFIRHLENDGLYTRAFSVLKEIARILRPGGVALVDEDYLCNLPFSDQRLLAFQQETNTMVMRRTGNRSEPGEVVFGGLSSFLMMERQPIDWQLLHIQEQIIGHI